MVNCTVLFGWEAGQQRQEVGENELFGNNFGVENCGEVPVRWASEADGGDNFSGVLGCQWCRGEERMLFCVGQASARRPAVFMRRKHHLAKQFRAKKRRLAAALVTMKSPSSADFMRLRLPFPPPNNFPSGASISCIHPLILYFAAPLFYCFPLACSIYETPIVEFKERHRMQ